MTETQERFLRAIADRLSADRIVELHLFPPIRQGGAETGVAVVAEDGGEESASRDARREGEHGVGDGSEDELASDGADDSDGDSPFHATRDAQRAPRLTIHTARYRLTLKGIDRGKWEFDVVPQADAPLVTVDAVVRGVQRRAAAEADVERIGREELQALVASPVPFGA
jgi:hypothetical protein